MSVSFLFKNLNKYQKGANIGPLANDNTVASANFLGMVLSGANIGRAKTRPTRQFATALNQVTPKAIFNIELIQHYENQLLHICCMVWDTPCLFLRKIRKRHGTKLQLPTIFCIKCRFNHSNCTVMNMYKL